MPPPLALRMEELIPVRALGSLRAQKHYIIAAKKGCIRMKGRCGHVLVTSANIYIPPCTSSVCAVPEVVPCGAPHALMSNCNVETCPNVSVAGAPHSLVLTSSGRQQGRTTLTHERSRTTHRTWLAHEHKH
jgi:hypothetical protein